MGNVRLPLVDSHLMLIGILHIVAVFTVIVHSVTDFLIHNIYFCISLYFVLHLMR